MTRRSGGGGGLGKATAAFSYESRSFPFGIVRISSGFGQAYRQAEEEERRRQAVAARPSRFLVVAFDVFRMS
jgi:hypothetical protein